MSMLHHDNPVSTPDEGFTRMLTHLHRVAFEDIPAATVRRATDALIDILGCVASGGNEPSSRTFCQMARRWGGAEESTLLGQGGKVPAHHAAFVTAIMARAYDYGVGGSSALGTMQKPVHICETLVPVAFAVGERQKVSGRQLLTALVLGDDLAGRLTASMDFAQPLDCRGTINTLGATAVAAKLLGLSPQGFGDAFALALHQIGGLRQGIQFNLGQGFAAMQGILAADLAKAGIRGSSDPVKDGKNLLAAMVSDFNPDHLFDGLGSVFHTAVSFKPFPCCRAAHTTVECALDVLRQGLEAGQLKHAILRVSPWALGHLVGRNFALRENPREDAIFSLQYALASTLVRTSCRLEHYTEAFITAPEIMPLTRRIEMTSEGWPYVAGDSPFAASLEVTTLDGRRFSACCPYPRGHELNGLPLSEEEKRQKFLENMAFAAIMPSDAADALYAMLKTLDQLESLAPVIELFETHR